MGRQAGGGGVVPVSYTHLVSEHSAATESLKKTLDEQTARMKAIKQLYDSSAAFQMCIRDRA